MGRIEFRVDDELKRRFVLAVGDASSYLRQCMVNAVEGMAVEVTHSPVVEVPKGRPTGRSVFGPDITRISDVPILKGDHGDQELITEERLSLDKSGEPHPSFDVLILGMKKDNTHTNSIDE